MNIISLYSDEVIKMDLISKLNLNNIHHLPGISKVCLNVGYSSNVVKPVYLLNIITGKKAVLIRAKKSIASFGVREGLITNYSITLRNKEIHPFLETLSLYTLPKMLAQNLKYSVKHNGDNLCIGLSTLACFPQLEHEYEKLSASIGVDIIIHFYGLNFESYQILSNYLKLK